MMRGRSGKRIENRVMRMGGRGRFGGVYGGWGRVMGWEGGLGGYWVRRMGVLGRRGIMIMSGVWM